MLHHLFLLLLYKILVFFVLDKECTNMPFIFMQTIVGFAICSTDITFMRVTITVSYWFLVCNFIIYKRIITLIKFDHSYTFFPTFAYLYIPSGERFFLITLLPNKILENCPFCCSTFRHGSRHLYFDTNQTSIRNESITYIPPDNPSMMKTIYDLLYMELHL